MGKSGKFYAVNDTIIEAYLKDPYEVIKSNGEALTKIDLYGNITDDWRNRKLSTKRGGYQYIRYTYRGKASELALHRAVYAKFGGKLDPEKTINHIDGNPMNNDISNLELVTQSENAYHSFRELGRVNSKHLAKINQEIADQIRKDHANGSSYKVLVEKYNISKTNISYIVSGRIWNDEKDPLKNFSTNKLTFEQAEEIREKRKAGQSVAALALAYGVGKTTIKSIVSRKTYKAA